MDNYPDGYYEIRDIPDAEVESFIHEHEGGASVEQIAQAMGLSRQRVNQLLVRALRKCRTACAERDIELSDVPSRQSVWDRLESS